MSVTLSHACLFILSSLQLIIPLTYHPFLFHLSIISPSPLLPSSHSHIIPPLHLISPIFPKQPHAPYFSPTHFSPIFPLFSPNNSPHLHTHLTPISHLSHTHISHFSTQSYTPSIFLILSTYSKKLTIVNIPQHPPYTYS